MGTIFGFVVGYVVGARAGSEGFARLEQAFRDVRDSDEFKNFVELLKAHTLGTIQTVNDRLQNDDLRLNADLDDLAARARARFLGPVDDD